MNRGQLRRTGTIPLLSDGVGQVGDQQSSMRRQNKQTTWGFCIGTRLRPMRMN